MSRIHKHLSSHAWPYATGIGMVVFLLGVLGTLVLVAQVQLQTVAATQARLVERLESIAEETSSFMARLNTHYTPDCTPENLVRLRSLQFETRFLRDIGLVDETGAVFCTTGAGLWPRSFRPSRDKLHEQPLPGGVTRYVMFDIPTRIGGGRYRATIVWQGRFNLVIDPFSLDGLYHPSTHALWFDEPGGGVHRVGPAAEPEQPQALRDLLRRHALAAANAPRTDYAWREAAFVSTGRSPQNQLVVQTHAPVTDALKQQAPTLLVLLGFSALLGILSGVVSLQRLLHLGSLDSRIGALLDPSHLRCVYQPIVNMETGATVGCEVLMRIQDGNETLMPDATIPAIMRNGLTWELDRGVMLQGLT